MSVITAHVVGSDSDLAACVNAGHMFKTTKVGIPEMVVINGVSIANPKMQFTVRNLSENELELFPYENMLVSSTAHCSLLNNILLPPPTKSSSAVNQQFPSSII